MNSVNITNVEHYVWGDGCDGWHLLKHDDLSVIQEKVPAGRCEEMHFHKRARQFFYVLRGTATLIVGSDTVVVREHEGHEVPPNVPHQLRNDSDAPLEFIVVSAPKSHGDRVDVASKPVSR